MTSLPDQMKIGRAEYTRVSNGSMGGNGASTLTGWAEDEYRGVPLGPIYVQQIGTASTALASGVVYYPSTATTTAGTLSATGALVSGGVATFDVPRPAQITSTTNTSTGTITIRGTDGYGASLTWSGSGPTGNTFGNAGSYVLTSVAFKTITTASMVGTSTAGLAIGSSNAFGLDYRIANAGKVISFTVNGAFATIPVTITAGLTATGTSTATTADVRGVVTLPSTISLPNDARYYTISYLSPAYGVSAANDTKENTYGATPFSA